MNHGEPFAICVSIIRWYDDAQPGWVECCLEDAHGQKWSFIEKAPVVSDEDLSNAMTSYPRPGSIACYVIEQHLDAQGRAILVVDTSAPWGIVATSGETRFELRAEQVVKMQCGGREV